MSESYWYEGTPTVLSDGESVTYLNCRVEMLPLDDVTQEWAAVAVLEEKPVRVPITTDAKTGKVTMLSVAAYKANLEAVEALKEEPIMEELDG